MFANEILTIYNTLLIRYFRNLILDKNDNCKYRITEYDPSLYIGSQVAWLNSKGFGMGCGFEIIHYLTLILPNHELYMAIVSQVSSYQLIDSHDELYQICNLGIHDMNK